MAAWVRVPVAVRAVRDLVQNRKRSGSLGCVVLELAV